MILTSICYACLIKQKEKSVEILLCIRKYLGEVEPPAASIISIIKLGQTAELLVVAPTVTNYLPMTIRKLPEINNKQYFELNNSFR